MIHMLVSIPETHAHSARELKIILLRDWPIYTIEEYDAETGFSEAYGDHRCSGCDSELGKETANGVE